MNHCMAVRTNWDQVFDRIHFIFGIHGAKGNNVVNMNEMFTEKTICAFEIEATGCTIKTVMSNTCLSSFCTTFEGVY